MPLAATICTYSYCFTHSIKNNNTSDQGAVATDVMPGRGFSQDGQSEHRARGLGRHL